MHRALDTTYDQSNGGSDAEGTWNMTCPEVVSAINTLMEIPIETITQAATANSNYLTNSVTKTFPFNSNTAVSYTHLTLPTKRIV